ncbi:hypothetical protein AtNW77_Chr5g0099171 [Arabidopsis thaliana]|uniref:Transmembrane protein n=1 Tax=Arabidopsis thaliana x Arabidopsis arenosa TaxID=1240361 RepID=A0A8T2CS52_9BRAS|nr:hypothetical protein ISN45_At05g014160 [Arabidopsis thaliana x Arabidopsis arenosa]
MDLRMISWNFEVSLPLFLIDSASPATGAPRCGRERAHVFLRSPASACLGPIGEDGDCHLPGGLALPLDCSWTASELLSSLSFLWRAADLQWLWLGGAYYALSDIGKLCSPLFCACFMSSLGFNLWLCRSLALVFTGGLVQFIVCLLVWLVVRAGFSDFCESPFDHFIQLISQAKGWSFKASLDQRFGLPQIACAFSNSSHLQDMSHLFSALASNSAVDLSARAVVERTTYSLIIKLFAALFSLSLLFLFPATL